MKTRGRALPVGTTAAPQMISIEAGGGRTVVVLAPHADDATIQCGGALALLARADWRVVLVRVTNDSSDSVGLDREATIARNTQQLHGALAILGIHEVIELGFETDTLAAVSELRLREAFIRIYRSERPYAVFSFDPFPAPGENNQDHLCVAAAADEAFWTAMFDKHHPEHFATGLTVHGVYERWYFARRLQEVTTAIDISSVIEQKIEALATQALMVENMLEQMRLQATTGGIPIPHPEFGLTPVQWYADRIVRSRAAATGRHYGVSYAEEFRVIRFSGLAPILDLD